MSSFRSRKISKKPRRHPVRKIKKIWASVKAILGKSTKKQRSYVASGILLLIAVIVVFKVMAGVYYAIRDFSPKDIVFALGTQLKTDENGYTNIVLLGDGGHVRDGADLIDTIMVASIDPKTNSVSLFSIPRDYYVGARYEVNRINDIYRHYNTKGVESEDEDENALAMYMDAAGEIANLKIQYYARVDFKAFVEIVDAIGGIEIDVKTEIDDPYYPNATDNGYQGFYIKAGPQTLDGETALKFARSRKTTSDFDRASRQQQILEAIYAKATSSRTLRSAKTIRKIYESVKENINTNMNLREMITLAGFAKGLDRGRIIQKVINDDPGVEGGFLYTPERRFYNGQFILVPFGDNLDLIHRFTNIIFNQREVYLNPARIAVLNASKEPGIARNTAYFLNRFGFDIVKIDNEFDESGKRINRANSFIRFNKWSEDSEGNIIPEHQATLAALENFVKGDPVIGNPVKEPDVDIAIVLGEDYEVF